MNILPFVLILSMGCIGNVGIVEAAPTLPVTGFADLHNHMFAEYAMGGAWLHGNAEGEISKALASCEIHDDPFSILASHARVKFPLISRWIGKVPGSEGDTSTNPKKHEGYPNFGGFPRWDNIAHQQVWEGHLKDAHAHGLNLLVVSAVNFEVLCDVMPEENKKYKDCSDISAVHRELDAAHQFEKTHDWFKIVTTPSEARDAIQNGKLAVVLSIEVSHLFGDGDWKKEFYEVYQKGVRTLQVTHQLNNRFAGAAIHNSIFRLIAWFQDFKERGRFWEILTPWKFGFQYDPRNPSAPRNEKGLTPDGKELVQLLMQKGMLIDLAHISEKGVHEIQSMTQANQNYPAYISHGHFRDAMDDGHFNVFEKSSPPWVLDYVHQSGGIFGLRTGPEKTKAFQKSPTPNDCQGSTKSFAQTYQYGAIAHGLRIAFGSDLNGFIQQTRPRFGNPEETCGSQSNVDERLREQKSQGSPLHRRFDQSGLGDVSQLSDILMELKNFGVDTSSLESSAENFIRMWEKSELIAHTSKVN